MYWDRDLLTAKKYKIVMGLKFKQTGTEMMGFHGLGQWDLVHFGMEN